jgi:hydroxyacylglutathione hydrolase
MSFQSKALPMRIDLSTADTVAFIAQISTASLGDHSYVIVVDGQAAAIDIQRDLERFTDVLDGVDADLVAVFETHIHNDYVSGGKRLADHHGAEYVLPADTGAPYSHTPLADGDAIAIGPWALRAMHTPGHTFNHTSYVLESPDGAVAIFSGGSLLVGAVGRSDLLGPEHTEALLRLQYRSAHRIAGELPDPSLVAPTHGTGSFCSASDVADTTSTVGFERNRNPALIAPSVEAFAMSQAMGYRPFPSYYRHMAPANLEPMGPPPASALGTISRLDEIEGVIVVDVRPFGQYAAGHIPGSLSIAKSNDDAVYMGWTLPWGAPVAIVGSEPDVEDVRVHLHRIGWDDVVGRIDPAGLASMIDVPLATTTVTTFEDFDPDDYETVVDVRDPVEHRSGIVAGAVAVHLADFAVDPRRYASGRTAIHCQSGYRATIAAGFAEAAGIEVTVVDDDLVKYREPLVAVA